MTVTIREVAHEAGVSTATVSRVLSGRNPVSDGVRRRVEIAIDRLGYRPNGLARSLRREATRTLGLVVPNILNPFFTGVARAVEDAANERGYVMILGNADEDSGKEEVYLDLLMEKRVDGILISPARSDSLRLLEARRRRVPLVFVDRAIKGMDVPVVRADGRAAIRELVEYLVRLGHERLAMVSGPQEVLAGKERSRAFLEATERLGVPPLPQHVRYGDFRRSSGGRAMDELLRTDPRPTAVFVANNLMTLGVLEALDEVGLEVPHDLSVASFDDVSWFRRVRPPMTAIAQPTGELGAAAAKTLLDVVEKRGSGESLTLQAKLMVRGSCGPPL